MQAPLGDVFSYWSNFESFSNFMQNAEEVRMTGQDTSHWKVKVPLGKSGEFAANVLSNPERMLNEDLENLARIVERGELGGPGAQSPSR